MWGLRVCGPESASSVGCAMRVDGWGQIPWSIIDRCMIGIGRTRMGRVNRK